jgi:hypothetical protein
VCFVAFFLKAKRFSTKRMVLKMILESCALVIKYKTKELWKVGFGTIIKRKFAKRLNQPFFAYQNKNNIIVKYIIKNKNYEIWLPIPNPHFKPKYFIMAGRKNVTQDLEQFIGPNHDFHNCKITPGQLGYQNLTVFFDIGDKTKIGKDEQLPHLIK